ncbi:hypothetical protein [Porphyromonas loveana]|uniref:hypothetical protein n=1 Tax=Porphyromonas loveana TaxID=1884669 RepID=UPI00359F70B9
MKRTRKQDLIALITFVAVVAIVTTAFILTGCKVKTKLSQRVEVDRTEAVVSDITHVGTDVQRSQEQRITSSNAASAVQSWLSGSVDLELVTRQYSRDSLGTYLASESTLKRKESSESGYKSELTLSILDSILQIRIDSAVSVERERMAGTRKEHSDSRERSSRSVNAFPASIIIVGSILLFIILTRSGWGITIINKFKKLWSKSK